MNVEQLRLMHEALDGEASADDARALDRLLSTDPEARAEYEELRRLFEDLSAIPKAIPEGLLAETLAKLPHRHKRLHRLRQLSSGWRVFNLDSTLHRGRFRLGAARAPRIIHGEHNRGNAVMSELSGKSTLWIATGVAAVAIIVGFRYNDIAPSQDMSGTIAPANRSVAAQPGAADMTVASQGGNVQPVPVSVTDDASRDASRDSARDAARDASRDASRDAAKDAARDASRDASRDAAKDAARDASRDASRDAARDTSPQ
jgi:anti-sigma factor RsiW